MENAKAPTLMFPIDLDGAPKVTLAEREWSIVKPAIKQASKIVPALMAIIPLVGSAIGSVTVGDDGKNVVDEKRLMSAMSSIDETAFQTIATAVFWSVKRGYPQLSQAEFDEMPISLFELILALPVIMRQVGFVRPKPVGETPAGEDMAIDQSTGTSL